MPQVGFEPLTLELDSLWPNHLSYPATLEQVWLLYQDRWTYTITILYVVCAIVKNENLSPTQMSNLDLV